MEQPKFSVQYFVDKFENTKEEEWGTGTEAWNPNSKTSCALGKCGEILSKAEGGGYNYPTRTPESRYLIELFREYFLLKYPDYTREINEMEKRLVYSINDEIEIVGIHSSMWGKTPKERILNVLYEIKAMKEQEEVDKVDITEIHNVLQEQSELVN